LRLHQLTKDLDADGKRLLELAKELGLGVKSHSSNLAKGIEGILRAAWSEELLERTEKAERDAAKKAKADGGLSIAVTIRNAKAAEDETVAEQAVAEEPAATTEIESEPDAEVVDTDAITEAETGSKQEVGETVESDDASATPAVAETAEEESPEPVAEPGDDSSVEEKPVADVDGTDEFSKPVEAPISDSDESIDEEQRAVVVTFGGKPAGGDEESDEEQADEDDATRKIAASHRDSAGEDKVDKDSHQVGVKNVPTRRERKGAKILGKIDLVPAAEPAPRSGSRAATARRLARTPTTAASRAQVVREKKGAATSSSTLRTVPPSPRSGLVTSATAVGRRHGVRPCGARGWEAAGPRRRSLHRRIP